MVAVPPTEGSRVVKPLLLLAATGAVLLMTSAVQAKPARCFTSDDGTYPCDFRSTDSDGSFEIRAPGKLFGNISTPSLVIHEGVVFEGQCSMGSDAQRADKDRKVAHLERPETAPLKVHSEGAK